MVRDQYGASQYVLSVHQVEKIMYAATSVRDRLIVESLYFPALRRFEVANLDVRDIDFERGRLVVRGKMGKVAPVPVGAVYPSYMNDLKHFVGKRGEGAVFMSNRRKRMTLSRINQIVAVVGVLAGVVNPNPRKKHVNPHLFRHSQARHLKEMFPGEFVQNYLRHSSIKVTMDQYGTLGLDDMERMANESRGLSGWQGKTEKIGHL